MSWKNPAYTGTKRFHRVGLSGNPVIRADFEDEMASRASATEMEIIPGNTILLRPEGAEFDLDYFKTQSREHKIDAVVVSRLVNIKNTVTYVPGAPYMPPYYNTFYSYYGTIYPMVYSPGYLKEEKKVRIETLSIPSVLQKANWCGRASLILSTLPMRRGRSRNS